MGGGGNAARPFSLDPTAPGWRWLEGVCRSRPLSVAANYPPLIAVGARVRKLLGRFGRDTAAATAFEYCLIATLIGAAIIAGATVLGTSLNAHYSDIADRVRTN